MCFLSLFLYIYIILCVFTWLHINIKVNIKYNIFFFLNKSKFCSAFGNLVFVIKFFPIFIFKFYQLYSLQNKIYKI